MKYKSNFLKSVIFRLDFSVIKELEEDSDPGFTELLSGLYSSPVKKIIKTVNFQILPDGTKSIAENESWVWQYRQINCSNKILTLMKDALVFECNNNEYRDFQDFEKDIQLFLSGFFKKYAIEQFSRMGLRYINEIFVSGRNPLKWKGLISENLCKAIEAGISKDSQPIRSMHQLEMKENEINILFNYGIFNKDYPNPIARPELVLDFDYYINGLIEKNEINDNVKKLNLLATEMFEASIKNDLREKMEIDNEENDKTHTKNSKDARSKN